VSTAADVYDRTLIRWGEGDEMTAHESALWHVSDHATLRAASVIVEVLDVVPDWDRFVHGHAWALGRVPRLRQRVVSDPLRLGPPRWVDTQVDLAHHVRRFRLRPGDTFDRVLEVAGAMHEAVFAPDRPLWRATLIEGLPGRRAAYVLKLHHAMASDQAVVALFDLLHSDTREPTAGAARLPPGHHDAVSPARLGAAHAVRALHRVPAAAATAMVGFARRPRRTIQSSADITRAAAAILSGGPDKGSPVLAARGSTRAFGALTIPLASLRTAADDVGATPDEVALALVLGGLGQYLVARGAEATELPIAIPIQMRFDGLNSRSTRARILAPSGTVPLGDRVAELRSRIAAAQERSTVDLMAALAPTVSRTPTAVLRRAIEHSTRPLALRGVVVRGLQRDAYLAGAKVLETYSFGPTEGAAMSATLLTHQHTACLAFNFDRAAITDVAVMRTCLQAAFDRDTTDHRRAASGATTPPEP